ncbi:MAG: endonuclease/exonuclease/phosphatase family protein [Flavobacteriales bacterium]|nr:endonuclease/exonuclease/phosphatase family protein [Flavobacteriales bacterium]MCX7769253.1 endonuclease/exonuclease/phosphatase family protein [Flavobacteriales bacterium]MDW8409998.1 endonuclease/exonuclease/phosphatase family protein [Flavobacteriales bacterium]
MKKHILRTAFIIILILVLGFAAFLAYCTITDYVPPPRENLYLEGQGLRLPYDKADFTVMTWNIGYAGLGAESDFFFDGGHMVRTNLEATEKHLNQILNFLVALDSVDFILLQEVDVNSRRTYGINQVKALQKAMPERVASFAKNYDSPFVPIPLRSPYGKVEAGLLSLSRYMPALATRIALTPDASWPKGLFMLDRCLLEWRFPLINGRHLILYNLHLSAYDDGSVKQQQMDSLKAIFLREYEKGNYIIAGGDWNQTPPGYSSARQNPHLPPAISVPTEFPASGWKWAFQTSVPTNRSLEAPYDPANSPTTVIDYFLLSPNLEVLSVRGIDLGFQDSDHQPVLLQFRIPDLYFP